MTNDRQVVDMIERANDTQPFCACGRHTTPVAHDGAVWLECASLSQPNTGGLARLRAAVTAQTHTRERIVDLPRFASGEGGQAG
jgi:hypothetical protein